MLARLVVLVVLSVVLGTALMYLWAIRPFGLPQAVELDVSPGSSAGAISRQAQRAGIALYEPLFVMLVRFSGDAGRLQAGTYLVTPDLSPWKLVGKLKRGEVMLFNLVIPEGWTFRQMRLAIETNPNLRATLAGASESDILAAIGAVESHPEGLFFPDTYNFSRGSTDVAVYRRAYQAQRRLLESLWPQRAPDSPLRTPYEALILASIVEKETGRADERARVAGVFINRLRIGMRLQTDPTIIYGMGDRFDGNLRRRHLQQDSPYNTYLRAGLPPTPIALPGRAALEAALRPEATSAMYFVARGDGTSEFSNDLDAHNRAVNRWQRGRP